MTQPIPPQPGNPYPTPPQGPMAPLPQQTLSRGGKPSWLTSKPMIGLAAGIVGLAFGAGTARSDSSVSAVPTPAATVTITATAPASAPEPAEEPDATSAYTPSKSDFTLGVKVLTKKCFGSAGCNVTFRIKPTYVGTQDLPTTGTIEVSYKIKGGDEPLTNTFTVADGEASYDSEEYIGTRSSSSKLTAVVTEVEYSEW